MGRWTVKNVTNAVKKLAFVLAFLLMAAVAGLASARQGEADAAIKPGVYALSNDAMKGHFELFKDQNSYRAHIHLIQTESEHVADFAGTATVAKNRVVIDSTEGDKARITITVANGIAVVKANQEAEMLYKGVSATFNGRYSCKPQKQNTRP